jgi:DNA adenine methylase/adenine-specific DNA-methyltransferase
MSVAAVFPEPEIERHAPAELPVRAKSYPQLRFMGSKHRLLPWLHEILSQVEFDTALDAFSGSGCVAYLLKSMGKEVTTNDFLNFAGVLSTALVENSSHVLRPQDVARLLAEPAEPESFIEDTFRGIFFTPEDLRFLDGIWANLRKLRNPQRKALALAALIRSCVKRQPRGVFTVAGDPERYKDGRRDLRLSLRDHFIEQVDVFNRSVFDNGRANRALRGDVFAVDPGGFDLVYMDPPYVPRSDDNCYMKRYHFLEGLSCYWQGMTLLEDTRVKKIKKPYTPFSYRRDSLHAFDRLFSHFRKSILALSYSSNGYPDLDVLVRLMRKHKSSVTVFEKEHRYHFGTHAAVNRSVVAEYLILGDERGHRHSRDLARYLDRTAQERTWQRHQSSDARQAARDAEPWSDHKDLHVPDVPGAPARPPPPPL